MADRPVTSYRATLPCVIAHHDATGTPTGKRFELQRKIAEGGFGEVYEGADLASPGKTAVAIKFLWNDYSRDETTVKRFVKEAKITMRVKSPNVVATRDYGRDQDGLWFTVMEYVDSEANLDHLVSDRFDQFTKNGVRRHLVSRDKIDTSLVPIGELCSIVEQICDGMQAIHDEDVIHRDLKPENIMIVVGADDERRLKIADLGIARYLAPPKDDTSLGATLTQRGGVVGTPHYMAPEQITMIPQIIPGSPKPKEWVACVQSDIYAVGVIIYQMITGQYPFAPERDAENWWDTFCGKVVHEEYPAPPVTNFVIPGSRELREFRELEAYLLQKLLAKKPWNRPSSMREVKEWFADFHARYARKVREREGITANLPEPVVEVQRSVNPPPAQTGRTALFALIAIVCIGAVGAVGYVFASGPAKKPEPTSFAPRDSVAPRDSAPIQPTASQSAKRIAGNGPAKGSAEARDYDRAVKSGNCEKAVSYGLLTLMKYPDYAEPHLVIGDCKRKSGNAKEACASYASYLAFEGVTLSGDAEKFVARKCAPLK